MKPAEIFVSRLDVDTTVDDIKFCALVLNIEFIFFQKYFVESINRIPVTCQIRFLLPHFEAEVAYLVSYNIIFILPIVLFQMHACNKIEISSSIHSVHCSVNNKIYSRVTDCKPAYNLNKHYYENQSKHYHSRA